MMHLLILAAAQISLNSPVLPTQPTILSEIRRGMDAAFTCEDPEMLEHMRRYQACITAIRDANRQHMGTSYQAFDIGLYRMARDRMADAVSIISTDRSGLFDLELARAGLDVEQAGYQQSKSALGLTEAQVDEAVHKGSNP